MPHAELSGVVAASALHTAPSIDNALTPKRRSGHALVPVATMHCFAPSDPRHSRPVSIESRESERATTPAAAAAAYQSIYRQNQSVLAGVRIRKTA